MAKLREYDLFIETAKEKESASNIGFFTSYLILPVIMIALTTYTAISLSNKFDSKTEFYLMQKGDSVSFPLTCNLESFCIVVHGCAGKYKATKIKSKEKKDIVACYAGGKFPTVLLMSGEHYLEADDSNNNVGMQFTHDYIRLGQSKANGKSLAKSSFELLNPVTNQIVNIKLQNQLFVTKKIVIDNGVSSETIQFADVDVTETITCVPGDLVCEFFMIGVGRGFNRELISDATSYKTKPDLMTFLVDVANEYGYSVTPQCHAIYSSSGSSKGPDCAGRPYMLDIHAYPLLLDPLAQRITDAYLTDTEIFIQTLSAIGGFYGIVFTVLKIIVHYSRPKQTAISSTPPKSLA